ncbi:hydroxyacylglutathione hydrolase [Tabrizicola sp.]|jgi:hydroxyacylglutathione hydrolase|uniref:hydroxyacylglutathione hydrolase n=1 Tax=Tabrizicola sp. TaxID=2005166 RepID=UPI0025D4FF72|nr:hydroxyacylglutathione hydrolase [Tabrizicola sp.]MBY0349381.1 hydroxyacylglutathione hydrolase [Tabrizicola sp.]
MPLELVTIPCLSDNYAYLIHDAETGQTAVIDVPETGPILAALEAHQWRLTDILITHHHDDHIQGVDALRARTGARVLGAAADAHRLPRLDQTLTEADTVFLGRDPARVIDVPGHTLGHIAFHFPDSRLCFTADSLMSGGCGRLFEGSPAQMHASLRKLAALPPDTLVCSGHEYTAANLRFAATLEPDNPQLTSRIAEVAARSAKGEPTVPVRLQIELDTNPYLRVHLPALKTAVGLPDADDVTVFAEIRARKDKF